MAETPEASLPELPVEEEPTDDLTAYELTAAEFDELQQLGVPLCGGPMMLPPIVVEEMGPRANTAAAEKVNGFWAARAEEHGFEASTVDLGTGFQDPRFRARAKDA